MEIKSAVEKLCRKYGTRDPYLLCRDMGIVVVFEPLGTVRGYYSRSHRIPVIHINRDLSEDRQRFTCCHELGHAVLHPKANTPFLRANTLFSVSRLEVEANRFAVHLRYPAESLRQEFEGCTVNRIAEALGLPAELVEWEMQNN